MAKKTLRELVKREELVRKGFTEIKLPIPHFYKTEDCNTIVYYLDKESNLYKRVRKFIQESRTENPVWS